MLKWVILVALLLAVGFVAGRFSVSPERNDVSGYETRIESLSKEITRLKRSQSTNAPPIVTPQIVSSPEPASPLPATVSAPPNRKTITSIEKAIPSLRTQADISNFLEKARLEDFSKQLDSAKPIDRMDEALEFLNGSFTGSVTRPDGAVAFTILLDASIHIQNQAPNGRLSIRLARDGKTFSRGSHSGDIRNIQHLGQKSVSLLISTGDYNFQLYYVPQLESFEGNCYHQFKPGSTEYEGTVHLERM